MMVGGLTPRFDPNLLNDALTWAGLSDIRVMNDQNENVMIDTDLVVAVSRMLGAIVRLYTQTAEFKVLEASAKIVDGQ